MNTSNRLATVLLLGLFALLTGCVQIASIPSVARSGETVVLGLGGINRNWGGEKPRNIQLTITDSASQTFPLQTSIIFQAHADYRSGVNVSALAGNSGLQLQPFDGAWFVTASLTDLDGPLDLAPGPATIHVAADNLIIARDELGQPFPSEGDLTQIPIEIVPGPPSSSNSAAQFGAYDDRGSHFVVRPAASASAVLGGAYYAIRYDSDSNFGPLRPMVFPVSRNPFVKIDYSVEDNGDGSGTYRVYVYNPAGFKAAAPRTAKQAPLQDLGVYFEYYDAGSAAWMQSNVSLDVANSYFIDIDGNRVDGLAAEMLPAGQL